jgi:ABC-type amino acid transport substrate-binding protein
MRTIVAAMLFTLALATPMLAATGNRDLPEIQKEGVLRHLGVPYANFVDGADYGLDVELMRLFAKDIGVRYEYVQASWKTVIGDLTGLQTKINGDNVAITGATPIRGDVIANGLTVLPWRQKILFFSAPTFPTQVWLTAGAQSPMQPIKPSGDLNKDIALTKALLAGKSVMGITGTCLDPKLYNLDAVQAITRPFNGSLNELIPAVLKGDTESVLLDVPDSLIALAKWPGQIKILGPISEQQEMAVGFRKDSGKLQRAFAVFYQKIKDDGTYLALVKKYYPDVFAYYPDFFSPKPTQPSK